MKLTVYMPYKWFRCKLETDYRFRDYDESKFCLLDHYNFVEGGTLQFDTEDVSNIDYRALAELWEMYNRGSGYEVDFSGPSMSVSDVIELDGKRVYYVEGMGWKRIDE